MSLRSSFLKQAAALAAVCLPVLLTGCGITPQDAAGTTLPALSGAIHGGQSPIQAATVTLYVTSTTATAYGQAATVIGTATTDVNGNFTINPSATTANCPAGQQAYITAAGGYPSGSPTTVNNSALMMVALGNCSGVSSATTVIVNEVTTVAAAYALSGFMTTSASGSLFKANVSAPTLATASTGTTAVTAGLAHAFQNATSLSTILGVAGLQTPALSVAGTTITGSVPAAEINTLGDILQSCVNSVTGSTACTTLFADTPSISGVAPTNTLQAMVNLARNPYPSAAAMTGSTSLFSLVSSSPAFLPNLTAAPPDWSMAIVYKGTPLVGPYDIALDANDTLYYGASASANLIGLSAYGTATPAYTAGTGTATRQIAPDALGNIWVTNNATTLYRYTAGSTAAPTAYTGYTDIYGVGIDKANNVWLADATATTPNLVELKYTAGSPATYAANYTATAPGGFSPVEITIDANQNIWAAEYFTNATTAMVLPNLSAASSSATPTYTTTGTVATPVSATFAGSATKPLGVVIDAAGNAWYGITGTNTVTSTGLEEVIPSLTSSVITALNPQPLIANATLGAKASQIPGIDGAGSIYLPDNQGTGALGIHVYSTVAVTSSNTGGQVLSPPAGYLGCYLPSGAATCGTGSGSAVYNPREVAIDSTGSVWAGITSGGATQLIGLAAPTWPLLAVGKPGVAPGLTTAVALP